MTNRKLKHDKLRTGTAKKYSRINANKYEWMRIIQKKETYNWRKKASLKKGACAEWTKKCDWRDIQMHEHLHYTDCWENHAGKRKQKGRITAKQWFWSYKNEHYHWLSWRLHIVSALLGRKMTVVPNSNTFINRKYLWFSILFDFR